MQQNWAFSKMHGLGNDFVVMTNFDQSLALSPTQIRALSHRRTGIGFDQLLIIEPSEQADFHYRIFNADGQEAEQCGNGARAIARYLSDKGHTNSTSITLSTLKETVSADLHPNGEVTVALSPPQKITCNFTIPTNPPRQATLVQLSNPHAVLQVSHCESIDVDTIGSQVAQSGEFPEGVNVGFMEIINRNEIRLRVFERGAGETLACGTGACAAMVSGKAQDLLDSEVQVRLPGGTLLVQWEGQKDDPIKVTGHAQLVYDGQVCTSE